MDVNKFFLENIKNFNLLKFENDIETQKVVLEQGISNKKVLVIGGAGTIGSNYIKEILKFRPIKLVVVDTNENGLTELTRDLRSSSLLDYNPEYITYPVNLLSEVFDKIFNSDYFDIVANFSAHKHVRSEKDKLSVEALIKNNVFGAIKLLDLCSKKPPQHFFSVSTDKAANPVNIMGASKSLMEKLILSKQNEFRVSTARFANVGFSNGSLLDGFFQRLIKQQPLSCPSDIKRFFVTPIQSGQICLLSTFLGKTGSIFFPKLDFYKDQIYFKDIAIEFLKQQGLDAVIVKTEQEAKDFDFNKRQGTYPIYLFRTDTSGEKEYEEFYTENEKININTYETLGFIESQELIMNFKQITKNFNNIFDNVLSNKEDIVSVINKYVPDFKHIERGKHLDQKM